MPEHRWERRYYWHDEQLVRVEWWRDGQPDAEGPQGHAERTLERDFCYRHGTPIYADLGCQVCRQHPHRSRS